MTNIVVWEDHCWVCGKKKGEPGVEMTLHHAIPKRMKPRSNVQISVCRTCHDEIHAEDFPGLKGMVYKAMKKIQEAFSAVAEVFKRKNG